MEINKKTSLVWKVVFVCGMVISSSYSQANIACSNELDKFNTQLPNWMVGSRQENESDVPQACISSAMEVFAGWSQSVSARRASENLTEIGHYAYCKNGEVTRSHSHPCPTETYLNTIGNSYNSVLKCLNLKPKNLFAITAVESGFQINSVSLSGEDIGIGQITPIAHEDINRDWDSYIKMIEDGDNPNCSELKPFVRNMEALNQKSNLICELTDMPENPIKNMLYLGFLQYRNNSYIKSIFETSNISRRISTLIGRELTDSEEERIQEILIALSYNAGSVGATDAIISYIEKQETEFLRHNEVLNGINNTIVGLNLDAQAAVHEDSEFTSESIILKRDSLIEMYQAFESEKDISLVSIEQFGINESPGSFGEFLKTSQISNYLHVLKRRIDHIEEKLDQQGKCAPLNYLEKINQ